MLFITIEDETGVANLIVWPSVFERQRRLVLGAGRLACDDQVRREGEVIHVITHRLADLSGLLGRVAECRDALQVRPGRGDAARHGVGPDKRDGNGRGDRRPCDIDIPDLKPGGGIKVPTRDFREATTVLTE